MRARAGAAALLSALVAAALAGCYPAFPQTQFPYDPSDGVGVGVGDVRLLNVLVITEDGEDGNLLATAVNSSSEDIELLLQYEAAGEKRTLAVELEGRSTTDIGFGAEGQLFLDGIDTAAGGLLPLYVQYGEEQGKRIDVPVLDDALAQYDGLLPTPTPTPVPAEPVTPEPTPSETPVEG